MSSTKKTVAPKTAKAPNKADTLRALKFLRKAAMEMRLYGGRAYERSEAARKKHVREDHQRRVEFIQAAPLPALARLSIQAVKDGKSHVNLDEALQALGYKPLPEPLTVRDQRDELVKEIDKAIYTMLGDFDSGIVAKFVKALEALQ
jgi:hypothetical protein